MMKLPRVTPLLFIVISPFAMAGQSLDTTNATQTQACYNSLLKLKPSISTINKSITIDTCLKSVDPTKKIEVNCAPSNTLSIDGIDETKLSNDKLAANLLSRCIHEMKDNDHQLSAQDREVLLLLSPKYQQISDTHNRWISAFELGYKQQNGYDDNGNRTGFDQGGITGSLKLNGRWKNSWGWNDAVTNFEVGVVFGKNPTVNEDKPDPENTKFNDVTDTIDGYLKFLWSPGHFMATENGDSVLSFAFLTGIRSLDEAQEGNELARYYGGGLEFNLYKEGVALNQNALPRAKIGSYYVRTSNYGAMTDVGLWVIQAQYQLVEDKPFLLGFKANLGPDELDDYSVTLSVRQDTAELLRFFGFITE